MIKERTMSQHPEITLPDKNTIFCLNEEEARIIGSEMVGYFERGIEVREGDTIIDVGGNVGVFMISAWQRCNRKARVFAFEPIPAIFEVLQRNAERHDPDRLKVFNIGLAQSERTATFSYFPNMTIWSSAYRDNDGRDAEMERNKQVMESAIKSGRLYPALRFLPARIRSWMLDRGLEKAHQIERVECTLRTLSNIIDEEAIDCIDLLKIDVEKSELDVLMGIEDRHWPIIRQVVLEIDNHATRADTIEALLRKHGFDHIEQVQDEIQAAGDFGMIFALRQAP
jgi:FkbM family methyltransferase